MHSVGLKLTKLTYTRLEDNLIRHRGDRGCTAVVLTTVSYVYGRDGRMRALQLDGII